ncbi:MAG: AbrB/MazE/SpoVT family DNA-binding domain-containing protein [Patescibacteria group bacterium]|nr:AbrB/MazE/SpoVT family DNA-binding domain-containing protein [Patescibacteria group bacterium]
MTQKIIKTGNSAAVTIPAEFLEALCLKIGDSAEAKVDFEQGTITYKFPDGRQLPLEGADVAGCTQSEKEREADKE